MGEGAGGEDVRGKREEGRGKREEGRRKMLDVEGRIPLWGPAFFA